MLSAAIDMVCVDGTSGQALSEVRHWRSQRSEQNPICWHQCRVFSAIRKGPLSSIHVHRTHVKVCVIQQGISWDGRVRLADLPFEKSVAVECFSRRDKRMAIVHLTRRIHDPEFDEKVVFFIRHAESVWNEARAANAVGKMFAYDHPLSERGVDQVELLCMYVCALR